MEVTATVEAEAQQENVSERVPSRRERVARSRPRWRMPLLYDEFVTPTLNVMEGRDRTKRLLLMVADAVALLAASACAALVEQSGDGADVVLLMLGSLPLWILIFKLMGLYDRDAHLIHSPTLDELPRIGLTAFIAAASLLIAAPALTSIDPGRSYTLLLMAFSFVLVATSRASARDLVRRWYEPERCLIVGSGSVAQVLARKITGHPEYGVKLVGFIDAEAGVSQNGSRAHLPGENSVDYGAGDLNGTGTPRLGDHGSFSQVCLEHGVERVVIAFTTLGHEDLLGVVAASKALNVKVSVVPRLFEAMGHSVEVDQVEGMTLLGVRGASRSRSAIALKRSFDISLSALGLLLLAPLLAMIALATKLTSPGPALYRQERVGRGDRSFQMYKFRTMVADADERKVALAHLNEAEGPMFKIPDDPRLTRLGRLLRHVSLDELPQLWNVMRGEMSLVGPRPLVPSEDHQVIGRHRDRLQLCPGLTGPWQVLGRTAIPFPEMLKLDYLYVAEWSLWNDIKLMLRTLAVVVRGRGI